MFSYRQALGPGFFILCFTLFSGSPDLAQAQVSIPPAGEAGIAEKSLRESRPVYQPPPPTEIPDITIQDDRELEDAGAGPSFFVRKIEIEGNTLISDEELAPIVDLGKGMEVTLGILGLYAQEVTAYHTLKGYLLIKAFIPAQEIKDGVAKLRVVEGKLGTINVLTKPDYQMKDHQQNILDRMWRVAEGKFLRESELMRALLELNDIKGVSAKSILKRGKVFGESDLIIKVREERPFTFSFDADNFGSSFTGTNRFAISGSLGNILTLADRFSFSKLRSDQGQNFIQASYLFPVNRYGTTLDFSYIYSDHQLGGIVAPLNAKGKSRIFSFKFFHPLLRTRSYRMDATAGMEFRRFQNRQLGALTSDDDLRDLVLGVSGDIEDALRGRTFFNLAFRQGTAEGNPNRPLNSRFLGFGDTQVFNMKITRYQSAYFLNSYFILSGAGQVSVKRVVSPNQMAIGGIGTVRGYPLAEFTGDNGYTLSMDYVIPFPIMINVGLGSNTLDKILSFSAFMDYGKVYVRKKQPGEMDHAMMGVGVGIRLNVPEIKPWWPALSFAFNFANPGWVGPPPSDGSSGIYYLSGRFAY